MSDSSFKTPYKRLPFPSSRQFDVSVLRSSDGKLLGRKTLSGVTDGVWHTLMFAVRGDEFCGTIARDTGRGAPKSVPVDGKAMLIAYNVGCGLASNSVLSVLLNGVVVWADVPPMNSTRPLQFAAGSYPYDAVLSVRGQNASSGAESNVPILAATNGGVSFVGNFNSTGFYRLYIGRIGGNPVQPIAQIEKFADSSQPLPADLRGDGPTDFADRAQVWFVENATLAGIAIGAAFIVCCLCCTGIALLLRRKKRRSRDWD
jgi:hypothetical protein